MAAKQKPSKKPAPKPMPGSPTKVCFALGVNKRDLLELIHQGRTMVANLAKVKEVA